LGRWRFTLGEDAGVLVTDATGEDYDGETLLNVASVRFVYVTAFPDLVVEDIWIEPENFAPGETVDIYVRIANIGEADAEGFAIKVYFDTILIITDGAEGLGAGVSTTLPSPWSYTWPLDTDTHIIRVVVDADDDVAESNEDNNERSEGFSAPCVPPSVPTSISASDGTYPDKVRVTWNLVSGANRYEVYRATSQYESYSLIAGNVTSTSYDDTGVSPGQHYWYKVKACNDCGCSGYSSADEGWAQAHTVSTPSTPSGPSSGCVGQSLTFTTGGASCSQGHSVQYRFYWDDGTYSSWSSSTNASHSYFSPGTYRVRAQARCSVDNSVVSDWSSGKTVTISEVPSPPTGVNATDGTSSSHVMVSWSATPGAIEYEVWRAEALGGPYVLKMGTTSDTFYYDTLAAWTPGKVFWYKVKACNGCGCSDFSEADSGYAGTPAPGTSAKFRIKRETGDVLTDGSYYGECYYSGSADIAEWVSVSEEVEPGDILEIDPEHPGYYRKARGPRSTLVAGVVSTEPGFVLGSPPTTDYSPPTEGKVRRSTFEVLEGKALLALIGIVPVKVTDEGGPIRPGDLLVASSTPGYAMRWEPAMGEPCGLVGKALEPLVTGHGLILVLLMAH